MPPTLTTTMICNRSSRAMQVDIRHLVTLLSAMLPHADIFAAVVKSRNKDGWTPLHQAAYAGSLKCAEVICCGALPLPCFDAYSFRPFFSASYCRQSRCHEPVQVRCLKIENCFGYVIDILQGRRYTCSLRSCPGKNSGHVCDVRPVVSLAPSLTRVKGHVDVIRALVAQGGPSILDIQDADGMCALSISHLFQPSWLLPS